MQNYIFEESGGNRENNIISFSINNPFYLYASPYYYAYYSTYLNTCIKYYDGNYNVRFGEIHATNNLSLQSIARGFTNKMFANGVDFTGDDAPRNKMIDWARNTNLLKVLKQWYEYSIAGGSALIKLNRGKNGLFTSAHRLDNFFADVTSTGFVTRCRVYQDIIHDNVQGSNEHYMIMEERAFNEQGQPYVSYNIYQGSPTLQTEGLTKPTVSQTPIEWLAIPKRIRSVIKKQYPDLIFGKEILLPFKDNLGCELFSWTNGNPRVPNSVFGQPIADVIQNEAVQYDQIKYFERVEVKLARARANVSSDYVNPDDPDQQTTLDPEYYVQVENMEGGNGIVPIQFNLRADQIRVQKENILRDMAFKLNVSTSTIATFLNEGTGAKTATEIINEKTTTDTFFKSQTQEFESSIRPLIQTIRRYFGVGLGECELKVKYESQESKVDTFKIFGDGLMGGIVSPKRFVKEVHKDLSQAEQQEEIDYITNALAMKQSQALAEQQMKLQQIQTEPENRPSTEMRNPNKTNFENLKE